MSDNSIFQRINEAVDAYFDSNPSTAWFPVKKLMPSLIAAGVFEKDVKNGLPLRKVLRDLDNDEQLNEIPRAHADRTGRDIYWYFVREGSEYVPEVQPESLNAKERKAQERANSDEKYLVDMINSLLGKKGSEKQTFDYLLGDLHQDGETRTELPVDLYFWELKLAIEFVNHPKTREQLIPEKQKKMTVSGVTRAEQRVKYFDRKKKVLTKKGMDFVEIPMAGFECDEHLKLLRNTENDERVLRGLLGHYLD